MCFKCVDLYCAVVIMNTLASIAMNIITRKLNYTMSIIIAIYSFRDVNTQASSIQYERS